MKESCLHLRLPLVWEEGPNKGTPRTVGIIFNKQVGICEMSAICSRCGAVELTGKQDNTYWRVPCPQKKKEIR